MSSRNPKSIRASKGVQQVAENFGGHPIWLIGATGTLGQAMARLLSERGAVLAVSGRNVTELEKLVATLPNRAVAAPVDLLNEASVKAACASIDEQLGP